MFTHQGHLKTRFYYGGFSLGLDFINDYLLLFYYYSKMTILLLFWKLWHLMRVVTFLETHRTQYFHIYFHCSHFLKHNSHYVKVYKGLWKCIILCLSGMQSLGDTFRKCFSVYISRLKRAIVLLASHFKEFHKCRGQRYIRKWWGQHCSDVLNAILVSRDNREIILIPWLTLQK